jgi:hypothetical protein
MLDVSAVVQAISVLQAQRDAVIQTIYQISGISDIMRGATKAEETLGAQQLKANFGNLRMRTSQAEVARFASDIFKLKAQIVCKFYPPALIVQMSGVMQMPEAQQNPQIVASAIAILQDSRVRDFHICVESDSLAQIDEQAEKQAATEALTALGGFLRESLPLLQAAPQFLPAMRESTLFLMRRFRAGRELESSFEQSFKAIAEAAAAPKGPSKEEIEAQTQAQIAQVQAQAQTQAAQQKAQFDAQTQQSKLAAEAQLEQLKQQMEAAAREHEAQMKMATEAHGMEFDKYKAELDAATKKEVAEMSNATSIRVAMISASKGTSEDPGGLATNSSVTDAAEQLAERFEAAIPLPEPSHHAELALALTGLRETLSQIPSMMMPPAQGSPFALHGATPAATPPTPAAGKGFKIVRDESGRMSHIVPAED